MPEFIPKTPAPANNIRFFNWPGPGEAVSEDLGFTHACTIPADAVIIHVGGQGGIAADGTIPKDSEEEIILAFEHIELCLREAGLTGSKHDVWGCVYKIKTYLANSDTAFALTVHKVMKQLLGANRALYTGVSVAKLFAPGLHLEIEVEAFLPIKK